MENLPQTGRKASDRLKVKGRSKSRSQEKRGKALIQFCALIIILATAAITIFLAYKGVQIFIVNGQNPWTFITSVNWHPDNGQFGAFAFIYGSFIVTFLAAIVAGPIGIGSAIFMTEIAKRWGKRLLQPVIEILVGIPSVVYGYIGLAVLAPIISHQFGGTGYGILTGSIVVGIMILPTVTSLTVDAILTVPEAMKNASTALGATRWQTIYRVIIPAALPSILTAIVLGAARAFGEALAVEMVIGNSKGLPGSLTEPASTLTTVITLSMGHTSFGSEFNNALWGLAFILLIMSYVYIIIIRYLSSRRKV